jgi:hypothetical protein
MAKRLLLIGVIAVLAACSSVADLSASAHQALFHKGMKPLEVEKQLGNTHPNLRYHFLSDVRRLEAFHVSFSVPTESSTVVCINGCVPVMPKMRLVEWAFVFDEQSGGLIWWGDLLEISIHPDPEIRAISADLKQAYLLNWSRRCKVFC